MIAKLIFGYNSNPTFYTLETKNEIIGNIIIGTTDAKKNNLLNCPFRLSKENCDEIFGIIDVDELAKNDSSGLSYNDSLLHKTGFKAGFKKAMELNYGKVFTAEDLENFRIFQIKQQNFSKSCLNVWLKSQHKQNTEIEVEVKQVNQLNIESGKFEWKPVLDENGCLILTKINS